MPKQVILEKAERGADYNDSHTRKQPYKKMIEPTIIANVCEMRLCYLAWRYTRTGARTLDVKGEVVKGPYPIDEGAREAVDVCPIVEPLLRKRVEMALGHLGKVHFDGF